MAQPVDTSKAREIPIQMRDEAAVEINRLDEEPPSSQQEYLAEKSPLMSRWRDLSIMALQALDGPAHH